VTKFPYRRIAIYTFLALAVPHPATAQQLHCWEVEINQPPDKAYVCTVNGKDSKITPEQRQVLNTIIVVTVVAAAASSIRRK
jgi:hypothetical protein